MRSMKTPLALTAAALTAGMLVPAASTARPQTTTPGVIYVLKATVDETGIHIPKDKFTRNGVSRYPRGAIIRYEFTNKGTRPYAVRMWAVDTVVMKVGGHANMLVNWQYRGTYSYARIYKRHQIRPLGKIVIF
jgi:hypothetical protein